MDKSILLLKTGLFSDDHIVEDATSAEAKIDLTMLQSDEDWDNVVDAILDTDLVVTS